MMWWPMHMVSERVCVIYFRTYLCQRFHKLMESIAVDVNFHCFRHHIKALFGCATYICGLKSFVAVIYKHLFSKNIFSTTNRWNFLTVYFWEIVFLSKIFQLLNQAHPDCRSTHAWFLKIALVCVSVCMCMCVCVCVSALRALINSGVIQCDIDRVWLVKQVLRLFPAFNCFIWHLPSIK